MKNSLLLLTLSLPLLAQQPGFDFKALDKLGANSKHTTSVTLDRTMLKLAANFLGNDKDTAAVKALIRNLDGVYVRTFEFDKTGQYREADLAPLRTYLQQPQWSRMVETKDNEESTEVYIQPRPNDQIGGVAIITVGARQVTVVYVSGIMSLNDIGKLGGNMGIPFLSLPRELRNGAKED